MRGAVRLPSLDVPGEGEGCDASGMLVVFGREVCVATSRTQLLGELAIPQRHYVGPVRPPPLSTPF
eukprot:COSAG01_NODE_503_length_16167_cov_10.407230_3_plen_66_part_00